MKFNKKLILTFAATLVLSACGGSSSGGSPSTPNQPKPVLVPKTQNTPQAQNAPQMENNTQSQNNSQIQDQPEVAPPATQIAPSIPEKKIDGSFDKIGTVILDAEKQTITLNKFILVDKPDSPKKYDRVSGKPIIEEKNQIILPLADISTGALTSDQNADYLIGRSGDLFYGVYHDTQSNILVEEADKFSKYFVIYDENRVNSKVSQDLTATYDKKGGVVYGANAGIKEFEARLNKLGDVNIEFKNGKANGNISDENSVKPIFTITGDTKSLVISPTADNPVISVILNERKQSYSQGMEKAVMDIKFIDSAKGAGDQKYLIGEAKSKSWQAIMVSEKQ
ncbi:TPA: hypothetical protein PWU83_001477 [Mannheimia haemolytica]|nr:hypothetical protein [Mannheimia haemolytica]HDL1263556.1 hypothetical protein [Mannheimia haemolytica]